MHKIIFVTEAIVSLSSDYVVFQYEVLIFCLFTTMHIIIANKEYIYTNLVPESNDFLFSSSKFLRLFLRWIL